MHRNTLTAALALALAALLATTGPARAQDFPTKPISMVVPFAPGGPTDTVARVTAETMSRILGQQVIVENVAGAGGTIGTAKVVRAKPDGYTLLLHHMGLATAATLYRKLPYDTKGDLSAIGMVSDVSMTIMGKPGLEPNTLGELIAWAKARGDKVTFGNSGMGAASHLCGMLFQQAIQTQLTTVPYKGGGPVIQDLMGGQIDLACEQATTSAPLVQAKRVKGYAVTTKTRLHALPDVPTANEAGLRGFEISVWHGLYAPKGTPAPVIRKLSEALATALRDPALLQRFAGISTDATADRATPEVLRRTLNAEVDRWAPIIKSAGQFAD
ncbi:tripartite tricarboxylate transporter substrate-binding protein [uncultured Ramlibacter sp.]|uniref:tripartite tricarboxylate transporter substrate-binding protein n=1 Tax=uncultured Ramlibacter sp. TaxID=260755 RepID=UPI00260F6B2E|nr:tripartite tricarboxylate transporter substrate-binding protein [uncultured Ramlibacter sp.]